MEFKSSIEFIADFGNILLAINFLLYFIRYRNKTIAYKIFTIYLFFILFIQLFSGYLSDQKINNLYLSHYYFIGQFLFLSFFYYKMLKSNFRKTIPILSLIILSILFFKFYTIPNLYYQFYLFEVVLCSIPIGIYSVFYFLECFGIANKKFLILNSGIFIYLISSTLIFSAGNLINGLNSDFKSRMVWALNIILYLTYQVLVFIEWYKNFRKQKIKNTT